MTVILKQEIYFKISIDQIADRAVATSGFQEAIKPEFDKLIQKMRFHKSDLYAFEKLTGLKADFAIMTKEEFVKSQNKK